MRETYIFDALRTPRASAEKGGRLQIVKPIELAGQLLKELLKRNNIPSPAVDDIIMGAAYPIGEQGGPFAKLCALHAGFSQTVPGLILNRGCASSLEAINQATLCIGARQGRLLIAAGVESMSRMPGLNNERPLTIDPQISHDHNIIPLGLGADLLASIKRYSRRDLDQWAISSHQRALQAQNRGAFKNSLHPIRSPLGDALLSYDELVKAKITMEALANFTPTFGGDHKADGLDQRALNCNPQLEKVAHLHHAGNSSPLADGAGAVLLGNNQMIKKYHLKVRAKIRAFATASADLNIVSKGLNNAIRAALKKAKLEVEDIDLFELNETFSAIVLSAIDELRLDPEKVNVNGGAIAFGHPFGATGSMLVATALEELEIRDQRLALIAMGTYAGMGVCTILERVNGD